MKEAFERMAEQKLQLEEKFEEMALDLETVKLELELTKTEYEQRKEKEDNEKRKLAAELTLDTSPAAEVYKEKIAQLKDSLDKMTTLYEAEKLKSESKSLEIRQYENKQKDVAEHLESIEILLEALDSKETIIEELKLRLDEAHGYEKLVEKLTEESLSKDEELEEAVKNYKEKVEALRMEEEINMLVEEEKKELELQLGSKETELSEQKNVQIGLETRMTQMELEIKCYKDKVTRLKEEIGVYEGQIRNSGQEEMLRKMEDMLSKQARLSGMLRDARKFEIDAAISQQALINAELRICLFTDIIPAKLAELVNIPGYDKIALLYTCRTRCDTTLSLLKDKYLIEDESTEINLAFVTYITNLLIRLTEVLISVDQVLYYICKCNPEQYDRITREQKKWNHVLVVDSFLVQILELIKDELLSPKVSLDSFKVSAAAIVELVEELRALDAADTRSRAEVAPSDKFLAEQCLLRIDIPTSVFFYMYTRNSQGTSLQLEKAAKIHKNIKRAISLLRKVRISEDGSRYLRHWQMMEESFEQKFKYADCLWTKELDAYASNDWTSWLEAVDAQLVGIYNHSNYKELEVEGIEEKLNDVPGYGPWGAKNKEINTELSEAAELKQKIEQLNEDLKSEKLEILKLNKEINENKIIKASLERRLAENQQKVERVGQLEIEMKQFMKNKKIYEDSLEQLRLECDQYIQQNKELNDKLEVTQKEMEEIQIQPRKNSMLRGQEVRRGGMRQMEGTRIIYNTQEGNYCQEVIRKLIVTLYLNLG
jgi:hypothetical protein